MNKVKRTMTSLLTFIKHIKFSKKTALVIAVAIVACILIICFIDFVSPKSIVGIQQKKHIYLRDSKALSTMVNDYDPSLFTKSTHTTATTSGKSISIEYSTPGDNKVDAAIKNSIESYAQTLTGSEFDMQFTSETRAFKDLIFITISSIDGSIVKTFIFNKKGLITPEQLIKPGFEQAAINSVKGTLSKNFGVDLTIGNQLALDALTQKTYRFASNGIVIILPTKNLPEALSATPFYEVLVPNEEIYEFLN